VFLFSSFTLTLCSTFLSLRLPSLTCVVLPLWPMFVCTRIIFLNASFNVGRHATPTILYSHVRQTCATQPKAPKIANINSYNNYSKKIHRFSEVHSRHDTHSFHSTHSCNRQAVLSNVGIY